MAFLAWRSFPAPGVESSFGFSETSCAAKTEPGEFVTIEVGKIVSERLGEVQEMLDICDFAVGLASQFAIKKTLCSFMTLKLNG
jgi:aldehyde dehydrogenase (NAD+)